jgi:hypothetical protein
MESNRRSRASAITASTPRLALLEQSANVEDAVLLLRPKTGGRKARIGVRQ